ncbi:isochorismatase family protein [Micromonospora sp. MMS20-R2-23]|uniref:Isochorismatase family protein n=1 Tax=Micromonospora antibiotica TaxID=2807623 RepID=A0ABS3V2B2_9ACTN|nr:isochorismatase family protein [Micromonospora antibiotica]
MNLDTTTTPYAMPDPCELPVNTAGWRPDPRRAVLLVHDMQRYFLRSLPASGQPGGALIANTAALLRRCRQLAVPVVYTAQPGDMTQVQRGLLRDFWGPGMTATAQDRQISDELAPGERDTVLTKWRYSAFHRTALLDHLRDVGRDQLLVCGVYAHVGCLMTAVEAYSHDIETFLVGDAVADFSAEHHRMALRYAADRCAVVLSTEAVLAELGQRSVPAESVNPIEGELCRSTMDVSPG